MKEGSPTLFNMGEPTMCRIINQSVQKVTKQDAEEPGTLCMSIPEVLGESKMFLSQCALITLIG